MDKKKFIVTAAPPTSNGDLHIGHLAGPFLGADVFSRVQRMLGNEVLYISYGDDYQDYVSRKASELKKNSQEVSDYYINAMRKTLRLAKMIPDYFEGSSRIPSHRRVMQEVFSDLYEKGDLELRQVSTFYCSKCKRYTYEAFSRGKCQYCGSSSDANYCENCGHPQESGKLVDAKCITCGSNLDLKKEIRIYFSLTKYHDQLEHYIEDRNWRSDAKRLCKEILNDKIDAPVSRRVKLGVKVPLQHMDEHVLDTWYGGPAGYISASIDWASKSSDKHKWKSFWLSKKTKWIAFVGFDCTFSHGILYPGMLMAQGKYVYPDTVVTNKFYGLEGKKISTSRNHAIWGEDIFSLIDPDVVRLYLSSTAPENDETNFKVDDFKQFVNGKLGNRWNNWLVGVFDISSNFGSLRTQSINVTISTESFQGGIKRYLEQIVQYFDAEKFSLQKIAQSIFHIANEGIRHFNYINQNKKIDVVEIERNLTIVRLLAIASNPIMPGFSEKIKNVFQENLEIERSYVWDDIYKEVNVFPQKIDTPFFDKYDDITFKKLILEKKVTM